jgi:hypothetical protein
MLISCVAELAGCLGGNLVDGEGSEEELVAHCGLEVGEIGDVGEDVARDRGSQVDGLAFKVHGVIAFGYAFEGYLEGGVVAAVPGVGKAILFWAELDCGTVSWVNSREP